MMYNILISIKTHIRILLVHHKLLKDHTSLHFPSWEHMHKIAHHKKKITRVKNRTFHLHEQGIQRLPRQSARTPSHQLISITQQVLFFPTKQKANLYLLMKNGPFLRYFWLWSVFTHLPVDLIVHTATPLWVSLSGSGTASPTTNSLLGSRFLPDAAAPAPPADCSVRLRTSTLPAFPSACPPADAAGPGSPAALDLDD